jgi:hypothetical protein
LSPKTDPIVQTFTTSHISKAKNSLQITLLYSRTRSYIKNNLTQQKTQFKTAGQTKNIKGQKRELHTTSQTAKINIEIVFYAQQQIVFKQIRVFGLAFF